MVMKRLMEKDSTILARQKAIAYLRYRLNPEEYVQKNIHSVRDIYQYRAWLKQQTGTDIIISHIAQIIIGVLENGQRMRTLDCLKVLRSLIRTKGSSSLSNDTINELFQIYRKFIFSKNAEVKWCVSAFIKGQLLTDDAIEWLVGNWTHSEHILNRLLLYPPIHPKITRWAEKAYCDNAVPERLSELISLLINTENADKFARDNQPNVIIWAIFKSRISKDEKIDLLKKYCKVETFDSIVAVADRLKSSEILSHFLDKLESEMR